MMAARPSSDRAAMAPDVRLRTMTVADLDAVMRVEPLAYSHPWTRGNFVDSLAAGQDLHVLEAADGRLLGYSVVMEGVEEAHLLNLTVAPAEQGRGHAVTLLDAMVSRAAQRGLMHLWLEVRPSNLRARRIYERYGFETLGLRKGYYPLDASRREDALVMRLDVPARAKDPA